MAHAADETEASERMVLRTVYLPPEIDEKLRVHAFRAKLSKGDVIRRAIARELDTVQSLASDVQAVKAGSTAAKRSLVFKSKVRTKTRGKKASTPN